ncbi:MAG: SUMF1/EgtB/PvdO family nonheme iron enzyme [Candidatus Brocadiae bacterium]|nr:SUMF1/EgtB/PvdO family nonheme iron enzyme [Candidatus Brocadiia bacterium]
MKDNDLSILGTIHSLSDQEIKEMSFPQGEIIAQRYEIIKLIGAGGMGAVYLVKDRKLQDDLKALKIMLPKLINDPNAKERFLNEILVSQKMTHRNILRVYDYDQEGSLMFFTMEYIDGNNMREWIKEKQTQGDISLEEIGILVVELLDALESAHKFTVHRDIKPENILIPKDPVDSRIKICDFGLAQLQNPALFFSSNQVMGTYNYMAPEQHTDSNKVDRRADLYSVGVLFYEALTGKFPIGRFKLPTQLRADLPEDIDLFIEKSLSPDVEDRFNDAREMKLALMDLIGMPASDIRTKASTGLLTKVKPSVTPSLKEKTPRVVAKMFREKSSSEGEDVPPSKINRETGVYPKPNIEKKEPVTPPKPMFSFTQQQEPKSGAWNRMDRPFPKPAQNASMETPLHKPIHSPKSGVWSRPEAPIQTAPNRPENREELAGNKSGVWNRSETNAPKPNRPENREELAGNKSGVWNRPEPNTSKPNRPENREELAGNKSGVWNRPESNAPKSSVWSRVPKSGVWSSQEMLPKTEDIKEDKENRSGRYQETQDQYEEKNEAVAAPRALEKFPRKSFMEQSSQEDMEALKSQLPPDFLMDFIKHHKGTWEYEDYYALEEEAQKFVANFDGALFMELLDQEKRKFLDFGNTARRSRVKEQFSANLKRVEESGILVDFVQKYKAKWGEREWKQLLRKLENDGFYPLEEDTLRYMLHQCRHRYLHAKDKATKHRQMLQSLEKVHQYEDAMDFLAEVRQEGYWDEYFEQQEQRIHSIVKEFTDYLEEGRRLIEEDKASQALVKLQKASQLKPNDPQLAELLNAIKQKQDSRRKQHQQYLQEGDRLAYVEKKHQEAMDKWQKALEFVDSPEHEEQIKQRIASSREKASQWTQIKEQMTQVKEMGQASSSDLEHLEQILNTYAGEYSNNPDYQNLKKWHEDISATAKQKSQEQFSKILNQVNQWITQGKFDQALHSLQVLQQQYGTSDPMKEMILRLSKAKEVFMEIENLRNMGSIRSDVDPSVYSEKMLALCRQMKSLVPEFTRTRQWELQVSQHQIVYRQLASRTRSKSIQRWIFLGIFILIMIPVSWEGWKWFKLYLKEKRFEEAYQEAEKFREAKKWIDAWKLYNKAEELSPDGKKFEIKSKIEEMKRYYTEQQNSFKQAVDKAQEESKKGKWADALRWYWEAQRIGYKDISEELLKIRPEEWPVSLWRDCWNLQTELIDFSTASWEKLSHEQQIKYSQSYQKWYSEYKNLPIQKSQKIGAGRVIVRLIPPGRFWMGSPEKEKERESDERRYKVVLSRPYYIGKYEITQRQWQTIMMGNPSHFKEDGPDLPVEQISWEEASRFCDQAKVALPTEAQWEYACRAGVTGPFNLGENITTEEANYDGNYPYLGNKGSYRKTTIKPGTLKSSNAWGCYDFHGNVFEWCLDWAQEYPNEEQRDPKGAESGICKVFRGGSWREYARGCRSANRSKELPSSRDYQIGFRIVCD